MNFLLKVGQDNMGPSPNPLSNHQSFSYNVPGLCYYLHTLLLSHNNTHTVVFIVFLHGWIKAYNSPITATMCEVGS